MSRYEKLPRLDAARKALPEFGIEMSEEEFQEKFTQDQNRELSDDELNRMAGGGVDVAVNYIDFLGACTP